MHIPSPDRRCCTYSGLTRGLISVRQRDIGEICRGHDIVSDARNELAQTGAATRIVYFNSNTQRLLRDKSQRRFAHAEK